MEHYFLSWWVKTFWPKKSKDSFMSNPGCKTCWRCLKLLCAKTGNSELWMKWNKFCFILTVRFLIFKHLTAILSGMRNFVINLNVPCSSTTLILKMCGRIFSTYTIAQMDLGLYAEGDFNFVTINISLHLINS